MALPGVLRLLATFLALTRLVSGAFSGRLSSAESCGACIRAGGAWCTDTSLCRPDVQGACAGPGVQVGIVGSARCDKEADHMLASYLHAPRFNPLASLRRTTNPGLRKFGCNESRSWCRDPQRLGSALDPTSLRERFDTCGLLLLRDLYTRAEVRLLRAYAAAKLPLEQQQQRSKYEIPGVRGDVRREWVLPHAASIAATIVKSLRGRLGGVLERGASLSIESVSVISALPGANAQEFHRDSRAGHEAVTFIFIPLDDITSNGPQFCPCSHVSGSPEACQASSAGRISVPSATVLPLGGAVMYDAGLVHRGLPYAKRRNRDTSAESARVLLHIAVAPKGATLRGRPLQLIGGSAREHVRRWRQHSLATDAASSCASASSDCESCRGAMKGACAWCSAKKTCVADLGGMCSDPHSHIGQAGLGGSSCLSTRAREL